MRSTAKPTLDSAAEARKQVILADRLVISKTDLADAATVERLTRRLQRAQSARHDRHRGRRRARSAARHRAGRRRALAASSPRPSTATASRASSSTDDEPIAWLAFARTMETLIALRGADLLRVKGILNVAGCRGPVRGAVRAAPRPSAGRARILAGRQPRQPPRVHHARILRSATCATLFAAVQALAKS